MRTFGPAFLAALLSVAGAHPQPGLVRGTVTDAASGQPLPAAAVQLAGTWRGTIANDEGEYQLEVRRFPAALKVTCIGYASGDSVLAAAPGRVDFALTPVPFRFEPVVVTAEDPAEGIMREVIRRKQEWRPGLAGYRARAYTRRVLENEREIVLIGEQASEIYWDRERGLREVVKSRRVTRNQGPDAGYVSALRGFVDFYDDDIPFIGHELIGPTHPDALEQYRFRLAGRRYLDDRVVFDISVEPGNRLQSALAGRVSVLDEEFALLEIELAPSRGTVASAVPLPVIEQMDVAWRQQFRGFAEGVWLPVDYRASMKVKVGVAGLRFPAARFRQVTRLGEYEVNVDMPDSLYAGEEVLRVDSLAVARDSSYAMLADKVPLSAREEAAYASIDSTLQFERAFRPRGFLARFLMPEPGERESGPPEPRARPGPEQREGSRIPGLAGLKPELRYDRVAGAHLGLKGRRTLRASADQGGLEDGAPPGPAAGRGPGGGLYLAADAGYALGLERLSFAGGIEWTRGAGRAAVEYGRGPVPRIPSDSYPPLFNSAQSLIGLDDYFDYYWREGFRLRLGLSLPRRTGLELGFNDEAHSSLEGTDAFNLLGRDWSRPNPAVEEGRLRSLEAGFTLGGPYRPFGLTANRRVEAKVEHGSEALGGDFSFTRLRLVLDRPFQDLPQAPLEPERPRPAPGGGVLSRGAAAAALRGAGGRHGLLLSLRHLPHGARPSFRGGAVRRPVLGAQLQEHPVRAAGAVALGNARHRAGGARGLGEDVDRPGAAGGLGLRPALHGRVPPRGGGFADTLQFAAPRPHPAAGPARLERRGERRPFRFRAGQGRAAAIEAGAAAFDCVRESACGRGIRKPGPGERIARMILV